MAENSCFHCGDPSGSSPVVYDEKTFCCRGCKAVYQILQGNKLGYYYELQAASGNNPEQSDRTFHFLDNASIISNLVEFDDGDIQVINFYIPNIHCSSCIWILENLHKLNTSVRSSQVDFPRKTVRITFSPASLSLKSLANLLSSIGYAPYISLEEADPKKGLQDRSLIYKLGLAGFAFGNVMFLSFPEYFDLFSGSGNQDYWLKQYTPLFRWLMFAFSLPVLLYSGKDYFLTAYKGLRKGFMNIDIPIALGILALFLRSTVEILFNWGPGYFDSFTGLVFFLLLGRFFQQKTYAFLSFERDYKSYFPIAVTRINSSGKEENVPVYELSKGDRLLIRHKELIPADGTLLSDRACIDYSFVTGESDPVIRHRGDIIYAGGRQLDGSREMEVIKPVAQSYLTTLWSNQVFHNNKSDSFQRITDKIGRRFTIGVLSIASLAAIFWLWADPSKAANVFTAVLIIACPCALALAAPFTLGNLLRIFGRKKFYLKNTDAIEQMAQADTVIFDKTGTMTSSKNTGVAYEGVLLSKEEESLLKTTLRSSNHPLARKLYEFLKELNITPLEDFKEEPGKGIRGRVQNHEVKAGSPDYVGGGIKNGLDTEVHISANNTYKGRYVFQNNYRDGMEKVFQSLAKSMEVAVLSGDNSGEKTRLESLLPKGTNMYFNQKPADKLEFIKGLQSSQKKVMMVGDGLNDAGALAQSEVGIAISEDINVFSPACDGILDASRFHFLPDYINTSKKAMGIIRISFVFSLLYNVIGLYFAVTGQLEPVIAAILMPLSSVTIVGFTTVATNLMTRNLP